MNNDDSGGSRRAIFNTAAKGAAMLGGMGAVYLALHNTFSTDAPSIVAAFCQVGGSVSTAVYAAISFMTSPLQQSFTNSLKNDHQRKGVYCGVMGVLIGGWVATDIDRTADMEAQWMALTKTAGAEHVVRFCKPKDAGKRMIITTANNERLKLTCPAAPVFIS